MEIQQIPSNEKIPEKMTEMAAVLAHEIKNPLNSIIINLEVLKASVGDLSTKAPGPSAERAQKYMGVIQGELKRLEKVIHGFLELTASPEPAQKCLNLNRVAESLAELIRVEFQQKKVNIQIKADSDLPSMTGNSDQIKQALLNLAINAAQAMPGGGELSLETGSDSKTIWIRVRDTGTGIPETIRNQIFSPYFTTKERGSGLGLAIVRRITREHGGLVDVQSEIGIGSCFSLVFPRSSGVSL